MTPPSPPASSSAATPYRDDAPYRDDPRWHDDPRWRDDAHVITALVAAVAHACWPDGALMVDLDEGVIRAGLAPHLLAALYLFFGAARVFAGDGRTAPGCSGWHRRRVVHRLLWASCPQVSGSRPEGGDGTGACASRGRSGRSIGRALVIWMDSS